MRLLVLTQVLDRDDPVLGFTHGWIEALARHVDRVVVAPLKAGVIDLPANVEVRSLGKEDGLGTAGVLGRFVREVGSLCLRRKVDAVLAHMVPRLAVYAAPFVLARDVPLFLWYTHKAVDWSLRAAEPLVRKAFTASERSFRLPSAKKVVTGHGIDTALFSPPPAGALRPTHDVAVVGRIAPAKDPLTVVEAAGILAERRRPISVLFAGGTLLSEHDAYEREFERRIDELGVGEQIERLGPVPHPRIRDVFYRAPYFVTPSLTGSVDKTVLEAMACGRIVLTCNESFEEVLGDLAPRLMFAPHDAHGLAARLAALIDLDPAERAGVSRRLIEVVRRDHDLDRLAARLVAEMTPFIEGGAGVGGS